MGAKLGTNFRCRYVLVRIGPCHWTSHRRVEAFDGFTLYPRRRLGVRRLVGQRGRLRKPGRLGGAGRGVQALCRAGGEEIDFTRRHEGGKKARRDCDRQFESSKLTRSDCLAAQRPKNLLRALSSSSCLRVKQIFFLDCFVAALHAMTKHHAQTSPRPPNPQTDSRVHRTLRLARRQARDRAGVQLVGA